MTEKEIRKLNRHDLLVLLAEQTQRADELEKKLQEKDEEIRTLNDAMKALEHRNFSVERCGSMAEAALVLHDVFKNADKAAEQYLRDTKTICDRQLEACKKREEESIKRSREILRQAEEKAAQAMTKIKSV